MSLVFVPGARVPLLEASVQHGAEDLRLAGNCQYLLLQAET